MKTSTVLTLCWDLLGTLSISNNTNSSNLLDPHNDLRRYKLLLSTIYRQGNWFEEVKWSMQGHTPNKTSRKKKLDHLHKMTEIFNFQESHVRKNVINIYSWGSFIFYACILFTPRHIRLGPKWEKTRHQVGRNVSKCVCVCVWRGVKFWKSWLMTSFS